MSAADSAEYWMDELVKSLNKLRKRAEADQDSPPVWIQGYLTALDTMADEMGVTITQVYGR